MKKLLSFIWRVIKYGTIIFFISSLFFVVLYRFVNPPVTPLMIIRVFEQYRDGEKIVLKKSWVDFSEIAPSTKLAVVAAEDNLFLEHGGFDFEAIEKAKAYNERKKGKKIRGASTISQQTAKNVFLWPARSWFRKGLEVYFTFLIEQVWSKERILEVYLNVIETGNGVYGIEAASQKYFGKEASKLTSGESALIASILPNPRKWDPSRPTGYILKRQQIILRNMSNLGPLDFN